MQWGVLILAVMIAGCSTGPRPWEQTWLREPAPGPQARDAAGKVVVDLPTVLRLAGTNSLEVAWVRERVHEAHARLSLAQERFLPYATPSVFYKRHEGETQGTEGNFVDVEKQQFFGGAGGTLSLAVGDAIFSTLAARQRLDGAHADLEARERSITLEAALAYYDLLRETLKVRVAEQSMDVAEQLAGEFDAAVQAGRGFKGDVLRARIRQSDSRLARERALDGARQASIRLASVLRLPLDVELVPAETEPARLDLVPADGGEGEWLARAFAARPELRSAEAEIAASGHEEDAATYGPLVPELSASAMGGTLGPVFSESDETLDYSVALGWRIGPGGLFDAGRRDLAASRRSSAEIQRERVRQRVADEVRSAYAALRSRREQVGIAEQEVKDAEEALGLNRERQQAGMGLALEYLEAEGSLARARQDLYVALTEHNQAQLRLLIQSGGALR